MSVDPRLGNDVIARDGTFTGEVTEIYYEHGNERFEITGYSVITDSRGTMRDIQPENVIAMFQGDEHLFDRGEA